MRDLDFHGLRDDVGAVAHQADFASVRSRAGRLRHRRLATAAGSALAVAVVLGATGVDVARPGQEEVLPGVGHQAPYLRWAGAGDPDHLYAVVGDCDGCPPRLLASTDGGATWQERPGFAEQAGLRMAAESIEVLSRSVLSGQARPIDEPQTPSAAGAVSPAGSGNSQGISAAARASIRLRISVDGGSTWRAPEFVSGAVPSLSPGGGLLGGCGVDQPSVDRDCELLAVDPADGVIAPLANQPPLDGVQLVRTPAAAGLWVGGVDRSTGRPAVAVSRDRGATWQVSVFSGEEVVPRDSLVVPQAYLPGLATTDGETVFATFGGSWAAQGDPTTSPADPTTSADPTPAGSSGSAPDPGTTGGSSVPATQLRVYRSGDGGQHWHRADSEITFDGFLWSSDAFVTATGAHVLLAADRHDRRTWLVSQDGESYAPRQFPGLPEPDRLPSAIGRAGYLYQGPDRIHLSSDGNSWREVPVP